MFHENIAKQYETQKESKFTITYRMTDWGNLNLNSKFIKGLSKECYGLLNISILYPLQVMYKEICMVKVWHKVKAIQVRMRRLRKKGRNKLTLPCMSPCISSLQWKIHFYLCTFIRKQSHKPVLYYKHTPNQIWNLDFELEEFLKFCNITTATLPTILWIYGNIARQFTHNWRECTGQK